MNKKQMRKRLQRRNKKIDQNARAQERNKLRRREMADFSVDIIDREDFSPAVMFALAGNKNCYFCGEDFNEEEIAFQKFVVLESKSKRIYLIHNEHVYEEDVETPIADMQKNLTDVYMKIFEAEKGHLFGEPDNSKRSENTVLRSKRKGENYE